MSLNIQDHVCLYIIHIDLEVSNFQKGQLRCKSHSIRVTVASIEALVKPQYQTKISKSPSLICTPAVYITLIKLPYPRHHQTPVTCSYFQNYWGDLGSMERNPR